MKLDAPTYLALRSDWWTGPYRIDVLDMFGWRAMDSADDMRMAEAHVSRLTETTGRKYRVVEVKP